MAHSSPRGTNTALSRATGPDDEEAHFEKDGEYRKLFHKDCKCSLQPGRKNTSWANSWRKVEWVTGHKHISLKPNGEVFCSSDIPTFQCK